MRATVYGEELKPLREFMRDMITQYQTSLGLVSSFPRDSGSRFKKRPAGGCSLANYRAGRGARMFGMSRKQVLQQTPFSCAPTLGFQAGFGAEVAALCLGITAVSVLITGRESADAGDDAGFDTLTIFS